MTHPPEGASSESILRHVSAWAELKAADHVRVYWHGMLQASGNVDTVTAAGDTVWLFQDHGLGRILIHADDNVDLFHDHTPRPHPAATALLTDDPPAPIPLASAPGRGQRGPSLR